MSFGLQIFNSDTTLQFDLYNRIQRMITTISYSLGAGVTQNVEVPGLVLDGTWGYCIIPTIGYFPPSIVMTAGNILINNTWWADPVVGKVVVFRL